MKTSTPVARPIFESLEPRRLLSAVPTAEEVLMVELINRARANPAAEAARLRIDLNEGLNPGTISTAAKQPLAINVNLTEAARGHARYQLDTDTISHTGAGGTNPGQREAAAGYNFAAWGENIAFKASSNLGVPAVRVAEQHDALFDDRSVAGRGHRTNLLNGDWREVGSGVSLGNYLSNGYQLDAVVSVQDFGRANGNPFLTGVAFADAGSKNHFYDVGEGLGGIGVTATRASDGAKFATATWPSGGYSLAVPAGSYTVVAGGSGLGGAVSYQNVSVGGSNVKVDFTPDRAVSAPAAPPVVVPPSVPTPPVVVVPKAFATLVGGVVQVEGTDGPDRITVSASGGSLTVSLNGQGLSFNAAAVESLTIAAGGGDDSVTVDVDQPATVFGGDGNDTILGGGGADVLLGDGGDDVINGRGGNDKLLGGRGGDHLFGSVGDDSLQGEQGGDLLEGGSGNDYLEGAAGPDRLLGGPGDDLMFGGTSNDTLYGDSGNDRLYGQNQKDYLDGGGGADLIDGGYGFDTVSYYDRTNGVRVTLEPKYKDFTGDDGEEGEHDNVLDTVEQIAGGQGDDFLAGWDQSNIIYGYGGNDTLDGGRGKDQLFGGSGNDSFYSVDTRWGDVINGGSGRDNAVIDRHDVVDSIEAVARK